MLPPRAALVAGLFALPGLLLGSLLMRLVAAVAGWLSGSGHPPLWWGYLGLLFLLATPAAVAGAVYAFIAHGEEHGWTAGLAGVFVGALAGAVFMVLGEDFGWVIDVLVVALAGGVVGALAGALAPRRSAARA